MPETLTPKQVVTFRIAKLGHTWLTTLAETHNVSRAAVIRAAFAVARAHEREVTAKIKEQA